MSHKIFNISCVGGESENFEVFGESKKNSLKYNKNIFIFNQIKVREDSTHTLVLYNDMKSEILF